MDKHNKLRELKDDDINDFLLDGRVCIGKVVRIYNSKYLKVILLIDNIVLKFNCFLWNVKQDDSDDNMSVIYDKLLDSDDIEQNYKLLKIECKKFDNQGILGINIIQLNHLLPQEESNNLIEWNVIKNN